MPLYYIFKGQKTPITPPIHNAGILNLAPQLGHSDSKRNWRSHPLAV
ncbi:hypothetical protein [Microcoleus vaginatus]